MTGTSNKTNKSVSVPREFTIPTEKIDRSLSLIMHHMEVSMISDVLKTLMTNSADDETEETDNE